MAKKAQGTVVYVQTALAAAKTITGITQANPAVVSSTAHGYANGDVVKITGVVGMQEVNDRAFIVANVAANTFELKGVDSTGFTAYGSGGSAYEATMSAIGEVRGIPSLGGTEPNEIDASHLLSIAEQKLAGLPKQSNVTFTVLFDLGTANHTTLIKANQDLQDRVFHLQQPGNFNLTLVAQVGGFNITAGDVNSIIEGSVSLLPRAAGAWSVTT